MSLGVRQISLLLGFCSLPSREGLGMGVLIAVNIPLNPPSKGEASFLQST